MRQGITQHVSTVKGTPIRWLEAGAGGDAPFLLVHGWNASVVKWVDAMPLLAQHRRAIAIDLPGFGASGAPRGPYSPGWLAGAVRAFMDDHDIARAVIAGNSLGGLVAAHFAAAWPERTEALIGVCPALPNDGPTPPGVNLARTLAPTVPGLGERLVLRELARDVEQVVTEALARNCVDPSRVDPATVRAMQDELLARRGRPEVARAIARSNRRMLWALTGGREMTWRMLRGLKVPTMYLWGEHDRLVPLHVGHKAVHETPGAHLVVIDDCGHNPQMECPQDTAAAMVSFVRATEARDTSASR